MARAGWFHFGVDWQGPVRPVGRHIPTGSLHQDGRGREGLADRDGSGICPQSSANDTGAAENERLHPIQQAWIEHQVPQCGYCQSGQIMSAVALFEARKAAAAKAGEASVSISDEQINQAMAGNLCRCGTYSRIRAAIKKACKKTPVGEES